MSTSDRAPDGTTRKNVADHLYLDRGPAEACARCDANAQYGAVDLCDEMLRHLQLQPGEAVVDVGCGAGQHLLRFSEAVGPKGRAQGYDFSPQAVEKTRARGLNAGVADGAALPVDEATFDALTSSFSIYYLPDLGATLREWHRVLRPGGRAVISGPADDTNVELYEFHKKITGAGLSDSDKMALGFVTALPEPMQAAGFTETEVETFDNPITFPVAEDFITYWSNASLFARTVDDADREAVLEKGRAELKRRGGPYVVTKRVSIAKGIRA